MKPPLSDLMARHRDRLFAAAFAICKNPQDAEDVVQETFLAYYRAEKDFESEAHVRAWLVRVAVNKAKNATVCFWRRNRRALEDYAETLTFEAPADHALFDAVMRLGEKYRIVIHLFYYEDYSVQEIARILGTREGTVKSRLSRGRRLLKQQLMEEWNDDEP